MQARKVQLQINGFRRQCKTAFDDGDGLIDASGLGKLAGEFLEGRRKWRTPRRGPAQLFNRFGSASGAAQRRAKQGFDARIAAAACCLFEGRDCLPSTVLSLQGLSQDRHGGGVGPARSQDFSGELLGLGELTASERERGAFEQLGAGMMLCAADGWERRMLWHGACTRMSIATTTTPPKERPSRSGVTLSARAPPDNLDLQLMSHGWRYVDDAQIYQCAVEAAFPFRG